MICLFALYTAAEIGFRDASYSAEEGNAIVFVIDLSNPISKEVTVQFSTSNGVAIGRYFLAKFTT